MTRVTVLVEKKGEEPRPFIVLSNGCVNAQNFFDVDVEAEADRLGIDRDCAVAYDATPDGCAMAMEEIRCASAAVRGGRRVSERHAC